MSGEHIAGTDPPLPISLAGAAMHPSAHRRHGHSSAGRTSAEPASASPIACIERRALPVDQRHLGCYGICDETPRPKNRGRITRSVSDEVEAGDRLVQVALTADVARRLRAIANKLLRDRGDAEDLVQHACLTYVKTVRSGVVIREAEAFLVGAVHRAAMSVGRQNRRRAGRMSIGLSDDEQAAAGGSGCEALDYDALLAEVRLALPSSLRASLDDCLAGKSDLEIAARDGVEESAVRKRRSRLMAVMVDGLLTEVLASGVSQKRLTGTYPVGAADGQPPTPNPHHEVASECLAGDSPFPWFCTACARGPRRHQRGDREGRYRDYFRRRRKRLQDH